MVEAQTKHIQSIIDGNKVADDRMTKATDLLTNRMDKVKNAETQTTA